jgi:hypothetical protein
MHRFIGASICIVLLFGSFTTSAVAATDENQALIARLQSLIVILQKQLAALQANEINTIEKEIMSTSKPAAKGPKKNAQSCDRAGAKVSEGKVACYGVHDYGDEFGDDQNTCGGLSPSYDKKLPTGCVIPAPICKSGRAIASDFFSPEEKSKSEIRSLAKKFATTQQAFTSQLVSVWEYRCTNKPLTSLASVSIYEDNPDASLGIHRAAAYSKKDWSFVKRPSQVVVVGVYQGGTDENGEVDPNVTVSLDYIEPDTLLVLSSYEPVVWNLTGSQVKNVKGIYMTGYNKQQVVGAPSGIQVTRDIVEEGDEGYFIVYSGTGEGDDEFYELRSYIHEVTKQKTYLYFGEYGTSLIRVSLKG